MSPVNRAKANRRKVRFCADWVKQKATIATMPMPNEMTGSAMKLNDCAQKCEERSMGSAEDVAVWRASAGIVAAKSHAQAVV